MTIQRSPRDFVDIAPARVMQGVRIIEGISVVADRRLNATLLSDGFHTCYSVERWFSY